METKEIVNIAIKLKKIREEKELSKKELARKAGMSYESLRSLESGKVRGVQLNKIVKLSQVLNVTLEDLIVEKVI